MLMVYCPAKLVFFSYSPLRFAAERCRAWSSDNVTLYTLPALSRVKDHSGCFGLQGFSGSSASSPVCVSVKCVTVAPASCLYKLAFGEL